MGEMEKMKMRHEELEAAVIALGIVILIAGAKHAVASLLEQWRALVFLLLNLVVLSILFTSIRADSNNKQLPFNTESETIDDDNNDMNEKKNKTKMTTAKKKKQSKINRCSWSNEPVDYVVLQSEESMASSDHENDDTSEPRLSKEELNAKAEAFILMFRQQLALDAQRRRSSRPSFSTNSTSS